MTENINSLVNTYAFFPILTSHFLNRILQHIRTVLSELQGVILRFDVHLQLVLAKEGQVFMEEDIHTKANPPYVSCLTRIAIAACELMLWTSESWCTCGKIGDVVIFSIPNSSEVDYFDLITSIRCFPAEDIVNLDVSIGDSFIMQVLYPLTDL